VRPEARATGVKDQARTFTPWSHVVSLLYAQTPPAKAAAKCHVRLDLQTFLPHCAIVASAGQSQIHSGAFEVQVVSLLSDFRFGLRVVHACPF